MSNQKDWFVEAEFSSEELNKLVKQWDKDHSSMGVTLAGLCPPDFKGETFEGMKHSSQKYFNSLNSMSR